MARYQKRLLYPMLISAAFALVNPGQAQEASRSFANPIVVKAKVDTLGTRNPERGTPAMLVVTHVYSGDSKLLGKSFTDWFFCEEGTGLGTFVPFKAGQEGIWSLKVEKDQLVLEHVHELPFIYRSRPEEMERHKQIVALAEAMESYYKLKSSERSSRAKELVKSYIPEVSCWAIRILNVDTDPKITAFFVEQTKKRELPLSGQAMLDHVLVNRNKGDWINSEARKKFLETLVSGESDSYHAHEIMSHVDLALQHGQISAQLAIGLGRLAAENQKWPLKNRREAISYIALFVRRSMNHEETFKWLFKQVESNSELVLRRAAAAVIAKRINLTEAEKNLVKARLSMEADKEVASALREAVQR